MSVAARHGGLLLAALLLAAVPAGAGASSMAGTGDEPAGNATAPHGEAQPGQAPHGAGEAEAHEEEHGEPWAARITNTVIFFGILAWFAGPWLVAFFRERKAKIHEDLHAAERAREEAEARLAEMEEKLAAVDVQVKEILETATAQAEAEAQLIRSRAEAEAQRLLEQVEVQVSHLQDRAERDLRELSADLAVDMAREILGRALEPADRERLFQQYLDGLRKVAS